MAFLRVGDGVLHVSVLGRLSGRTFVFINSLGTDFRIWNDVAPVIAEHARLVLYDKRGHGLSDAVSGPRSIDHYVDDLLALLDRLDISDAILVGLSIGGMIAQRLAIRAPQRVTSLVLCDTGSKIGTWELWTDRMKAVEGQGLPYISEAVLERWFSQHFRHNKPDELAGWRNMLVRTPVDGYLAGCAAIRDADFTKEVGSIKVPTLCIVGDEDGATPPDLVEGLAQSIPGANFSIIKNAGHLPCIEQPYALAHLIQAHVREVGLV